MFIEEVAFDRSPCDFVTSIPPMNLMRLSLAFMAPDCNAELIDRPSRFRGGRLFQTSICIA
ncbi:hypothetical protein [Rhizobium gallicum]|uniref:hypothetical protein n=1 Tax=Rhizobium gallicum TaxID=56730 RepID=UPI001EF7767D|nr:hypothetical protein [Rhizobium gallicum]ULJ75698.1 hypothetical protein L2W42_24445 [Rhizobium gallicum]